MTSAWRVTWYVIKRQTTSLSASPGHPRPTVTSDEVKLTLLFIDIYQHLLLRMTLTSIHLFDPFSTPPPFPTLSVSGRAGRVSQGYCYRLVTRTFWNSEIPEYTTPAMLVRVTLMSLAKYLYVQTTEQI